MIGSEIAQRSQGEPERVPPAKRGSPFLMFAYGRSLRLYKKCRPSGLYAGNRDVVPLWKRGIKGDFWVMIYKSPLAPLFQRGEPKAKPEEPILFTFAPSRAVGNVR